MYKIIVRYIICGIMLFAIAGCSQKTITCKQNINDIFYYANKYFIDNSYVYDYYDESNKIIAVTSSEESLSSNSKETCQHINVIKCINLKLSQHSICRGMPLIESDLSCSSLPDIVNNNPILKSYSHGKKGLYVLFRQHGSETVISTMPYEFGYGDNIRELKDFVNKFCYKK